MNPDIILSIEFCFFIESTKEFQAPPGLFPERKREYGQYEILMKAYGMNFLIYTRRYYISSVCPVYGYKDHEPYLSRTQKSLPDSSQIFECDEVQSFVKV